MTHTTCERSACLPHAGSCHAVTAIGLLAMLMMLAGCGADSFAPGHSEQFTPGQRWSYHTRPQEQASTLIVLQVDHVPGIGNIVHVAVDGLTLPQATAPEGINRRIDHLPFAEQALAESVTNLLDTDVDLPDYLPGYRYWRRDFRRTQSSVWQVPVAEVLDTIEQALQNPGNDR